MDITRLIELAKAEAKADRAKNGQVTLGYLQDVLSLMPADMPCRYDTGDDFGLSPVEYKEIGPYSSRWYSHEGYSEASSETAYPSAYRGYYADCTFNAASGFPVSTVGHVLAMVNGAIGRSFDGYKGGVNAFTRGTLVWGGSTSHSGVGDNEMVIGAEVQDGICVLKTRVAD